MNVVPFPDVGEGLIEGTLVKWVVSVGQTIKKDDIIAQVGTDKSVVDIPSPIAGTITQLHYKAGDTVPVGSPMLTLDGDVSAPAKAAVSIPQQSIASPSVARVTSVRQQTSQILALPSVRKFAAEHNIDLSSIKASGSRGEITLADVQGDVHATISSHVAHDAQPVAVHTTKEILATPYVRQLARELGVDITTVVGTASNGRISEDDVRNFKKSSVALPAAIKQTTSSTQVQSQSSGDIIEVPLSQIRKIIAQRMTLSRHTVAHVTMTDDADVTELVRIREAEKESAATKGIKLTYLPFIIKACTIALKEHPDFNATLDDARQVLLQKKFYNVGFAADTPDGLYVPVIQNADKKSILELASAVSELGQKARDKKLTPAESSNGTFTISSVGTIGVEAFTPIVNYPEIAVLGIGRIEDRAVVMNGQIAVRKRVTLSLSFDHRVVDGADAARFLQHIITLLSQPQHMLLEMK
ncbi:MAG TPA: 2-oxo acid dehydrogenase subunit E2 [Acidobacteriota bacterium]|nr:2-oxo acid dehydrogenase subunit E2 [Acidobacteriota bacterium]